MSLLCSQPRLHNPCVWRAAFLFVDWIGWRFVWLVAESALCGTRFQWKHGLTGRNKTGSDIERLRFRSVMESYGKVTVITSGNTIESLIKNRGTSKFVGVLRSEWVKEIKGIRNGATKKVKLQVVTSSVRWRYVLERDSYVKLWSADVCGRKLHLKFPIFKTVGK